MSQYYTILDAVKTQLAALSGFSGTTFSLRKRPYHSTDLGDTLPLAVLSGDREKIVTATMSGRVIVEYPVYLTLFYAKGEGVANATALQWIYDRREDARVNLWKGNPLSAVTTVFDCHGYDADSAFHTAGLDELFDVSQQCFLFHNNEARS